MASGLVRSSIIGQKFLRRARCRHVFTTILKPAPAVGQHNQLNGASHGLTGILPTPPHQQSRLKYPDGGPHVPREESINNAPFDSYQEAATLNTILDLSAADVNKYYTLSSNDRDLYFGEGLPSGLLQEFEASKGSSVLVRTPFLQLCNRLQREVEDTIAFKLPDAKPLPVLHQRQYLLDGPIGSGKSVILAMLVLWARAKGWLVFYLPNGRDWTQHEYYFKNEETGRWDTPVQAKTALEGFLKSHEAILQGLPCRIKSPLSLGEGAGHVRARGAQEIHLPEGASLKDLVEKGVSVSQAAVSTVVRLREELELVEGLPILYAIDEYNSWFTLSRYFEATGERAARQMHADQLTMVHAFRTMETSHLMVAAFSHSTGVGKLPLQLPGIPKKARFDVPRYTPEEAMATFQYYRRQNVLKKDPVESNVKRLFFLANGNAAEMRKFARLV